MKLLRALLYVVGFIVSVTIFSIAAQLSGLGGEVGKMMYGVRTVHTWAEYNEAVRMYQNVNTIIGVVITAAIAISLYSRSHPGWWRETVIRRINYPTPKSLIVGWVIAVFTVIGYPVAFWMTWRFIAQHRAPAQLSPSPQGSLSDRLGQLDNAHKAGLINEQEHAARRAAILKSV